MTTLPHRNTEKVVRIENLYEAGISVEREAKSFYRRAAFDEQCQFVEMIVKGHHIGLVDGLPGTGKSSTLWWSLRQLLEHESLLWVHLDRNGDVDDLVQVSGSTFTKPEAMIEWDDLINNLDEHSLGCVAVVIDGANNDNFGKALVKLRKFVMKDLHSHCAFITMSNKIRREHKHNLDKWVNKQKDGAFVAQFYHSQHSWTLDEYLEAYVNADDGAATDVFKEIQASFENEWNVDTTGQLSNMKKRGSDGTVKYVSVEEAVTQKYAYAGGSIRWMASETIESMVAMIDGYLKECIQLDALVNFTLGQESPYSKTHLYSSTADENGLPVYSLLSQQTTILAVEKLGAAGIKALYQYAVKLNNPSFLGWVIEADVMQRCQSGPLVLHSGRLPSQTCQFTTKGEIPAEFDPNSLDDVALVNALVAAEGETRAWKPLKWNQGGYDIVFVTAGPNKELSLRFGQVTKSLTHSLKLQYFSEVVSSLVKAGYQICEVEIAFIVSKTHMDSFRVIPSRVYGRGLLSHVNSPFKNTKWAKGKEETLVTVYGIDLSERSYSMS